MQNTRKYLLPDGPVQNFWKGVDRFLDRTNKQKALYAEIYAFANQVSGTQRIVNISDQILLTAILRTFAPAVPTEKATKQGLYNVAFDRELGALIIANCGATLWCLSPKTDRPYLTRHIGLAIYLPGLGLETVNVGLVGDVYNGRVTLRSESACSPSFLFGSQRCNCCHQWDSFRELVASFNPSETPNLTKQDFENWVQRQVSHKGGKHLFKNNGPGFVFIHLDSQNGMGSGSTIGEFCMDLFARASLRHRGEYSAEQVLQTTMAGGFRAIGLKPDPRSENNKLAYRITPLILDYLGLSKDLIFLSNNRHKIKTLKDAGYQVQRVKSLGAINEAGAVEAEQRGTEFNHLDINASLVDFKDEIKRLEQEISQLLEK